MHKNNSRLEGRSRRALQTILRHVDFILRELGDIKALSHYSGTVRSRDIWDAWWRMNWRVPGSRQGT